MLNPIVKRVSVGLSENHYELFQNLAEKDNRTFSSEILWCALVGSLIDEPSRSRLMRMETNTAIRFSLDSKTMRLMPYAVNPPEKQRECKIIAFRKVE